MKAPLRVPTRTRNVRVTARPQTLDVQAVPAVGRPASFAGAIGEGFSLEVAADRTVLQAGDPVKLTFTIHGDGSLDSASLPALAAAGLSPTQFRLPDGDVPGIAEAGGKRFEVTVRVVDPAVREIPPIEYSWFNHVDGNLFVTLASAPSSLQISAYDATRPDFGAWPLRGTVALPNTQTPNDEPVTDGDYLYVAQPQDFNTSTNTRETAVDVRLATAPASAGSFVGTATQNFLDLALHRQRLYVARSSATSADIAVYDVTTPSSPTALVAITPAPVAPEIHDMSANGRFLAYVASGFGYTAPYTLSIVKLGTDRDGTGAEVVPVFTSQLPLGNPHFVGDTLYVRHNLGIASCA